MSVSSNLDPNDEFLHLDEAIVNFLTAFAIVVGIVLVLTQCVLF